MDKIILCGCAAIALFAGGWSRVGEAMNGEPVYLTSGQPVRSPIEIDPGTETIRVRRDSDGLFRLPVRIAGTQVAMIVDTGASRSILAEQTARTIPDLSPSSQPQGRVRTLSGTQSFTLAADTRVAVGDRAVAGVDLAIMETPDGVSVLGQDILPRLGRLTLEGDVLTLD